MRRIPVRWLLFPTYLAIVLLTLLLAGVITQHVLSDAIFARTTEDLTARSQLVRGALAIHPRLELAPVDSLVKALGERSNTRITVVDRSGTVLGETTMDPRTMDDHGQRPEVAGALAGRVSTSIRFSHTVQQEMLYVAVPVMRGGEVAAAVRTSVARSGITDAVGTMLARAASGGFAALLAAILASLLVSRSLARPIETIRRTAERFAAGDLSYRLTAAGSQEVAALSSSLNHMANQLQLRIHDLERRNREQEALFGSMVEAVLAFDADGRLLGLNPSARRLFELGTTAVEGRHVNEVLRHAQVQKFVEETLASSEVREGEVVIQGERPRYLQVHGSALRSSSGERFGAMVVLNDVTRQRTMETERRELVASVSHELRTPVTAIKGFLETLEAGAIERPAEARRFVSILIRQADRLHAMIEDLLRLARLERDIDRDEIELIRRPLAEVLEAAIQTGQGMALERGVQLELRCPPHLTAEVDAEHLERAVTNLVANAIRYSDPEMVVEVVAEETPDGWIEVAVTDHGCGIPPEHHERLFERFYTVDRGRSRMRGGTGLGLAIVKHVARAHGGEVRMESQVGAGSTFTISLPQPDLSPRRTPDHPGRAPGGSP
jgi:two-component system phosphate regulon sensor histidine kinase PhoR